MKSITIVTLFLLFFVFCRGYDSGSISRAISNNLIEFEPLFHSIKTSSPPEAQKSPHYSCGQNKLSSIPPVAVSTTSLPSVNIETSSSESTETSSPEPTEFSILFDTSTLDNSSMTCHTVGDTIYVPYSVSDDPSCDSTWCPHTCMAEDVLTPQWRNLVDNFMLAPMQEIIQMAYSVNVPTPTGTSVSGDCFGVPMPENILETGLLHDLTIITTAFPCGSGTVAYAGACFVLIREPLFKYDRPIMGITNLCLGTMKDMVDNARDADNALIMLTRTALHEVHHVLGFTDWNIPFYYDWDNQAEYTYGLLDTLSIPRTTPSGIPFTYTNMVFKGPKTLETARHHYNCGNSLFGMEMENQGGEGSQGSHWEGRTTGPELMLMQVSDYMPLTRMTLSIMQDSGFYRSNFDVAEPWEWGRQQGCRFLTDDCRYWHGNYFCTLDQQIGCSGDGLSMGMCEIGNLGSLPNSDQHFLNPNYGNEGNLWFYDYCPVYSANEWYDLFFCTTNNSYANLPHGQKFGSDSRCFSYSSQDDDDVGCFQTRCIDDALEVFFNEQWQSCPVGTFIESPSINITCPDYIYCNQDDFNDGSSSSHSAAASPLSLFFLFFNSLFLFLSFLK